MNGISDSERIGDAVRSLNRCVGTSVSPLCVWLPFDGYDALPNGFIGQGVGSSINWLWITGAVLAAWMVVSAMNRRQVRLTAVLREHVQKHKDAIAASEEKTDEPTPPPE